MAATTPSSARADPISIIGGSGDDTLNGGAGNDTVQGSVGEDFLFSGKGDDILDGQGDSDKYFLQMSGADKHSWIEAFDTGASGTDLLDITGSVWDDRFLLRAATDESDPNQYAFVAMLNTAYDVERINYRGLERIIVKGSLGDDSSTWTTPGPR